MEGLPPALIGLHCFSSIVFQGWKCMPHGLKAQSKHKMQHEGDHLFPDLRQVLTKVSSGLNRFNAGNSHPKEMPCFTQTLYIHNVINVTS